MTLVELQRHEAETWAIYSDLNREYLDLYQTFIDASKKEGGLAEMIVLNERLHRLNAAQDVARYEWNQARLAVKAHIDKLVRS